MKHTVDGIGWNVYEQGSGSPALVFLHYFGGSGQAWQEVMTCLEADYRCIAPDLRGFGASSDVPPDYTVTQAAQDVMALIASLGSKEYVLAGHSMGGKIALLLAAQHPPNLRGLILVAPSPPTPEPMQEMERVHLLATHGSAAAARNTLGKITAIPLPMNMLAQAISDNLQTSERAWKWWLEHGSREDISPHVGISSHVGAVDVPVLVVAGGQDPVIPASLVRSEFAALTGRQSFPASEIHVLPQSGHLLPLEAAAALSNLIGEFLETRCTLKSER